MRFSLYMTHLVFVLAVACCAAPRPSFSHGLMIEPPTRAIGTVNEDYQFCFGTPGCECGEFPDAGPVVATYRAGQTIQVTIDVTISHDTGATFRFQLCPPDQLTADCFVAGEFATIAFDQNTGLRTYEISLPSEFECDPCVLRWRWDYGFLSCADVRIVADGLGSAHPTWTTLKSAYR